MQNSSDYFDINASKRRKRSRKSIEYCKIGYMDILYMETIICMFFLLSIACLNIFNEDLSDKFFYVIDKWRALSISDDLFDVMEKVKNAVF